MKFDKFHGDGKPTAAEVRLRERCRDYLKRRSSELPKLSRKQTAAVIDMLFAAYTAGSQDTADDWMYSCLESARVFSRRGVSARRAKASRASARVVEKWTAAVRAGRDVSVEAIASECGVSRATAYRALTASKAK